MASYAIGDLQGCYKTLQALLVTLRFDAQLDTLWFVGDVVNRGADSLACLRFIKNLGSAAIVVLGNHDLHLLAVAAGVAKNKRGDTLDAILSAPDCTQLLDWLRHRPLLHVQTLGTGTNVMVHAGIWPSWTLQQAQTHAHEVETALQSPAYTQFLNAMYGSEPNSWHDTLAGFERLRFITNTFTRMRALKDAGDLTSRYQLDTKFKGPIDQMPPNHQPWFAVPSPRDSALTACSSLVA